MSLFKSSNPPKRTFTQPDQTTLQAEAFQSVIANLAWMYKDIKAPVPAGMVALSQAIVDEVNTNSGNKKLSKALIETMEDMRKVLMDVNKCVKQGELHWPNNQNHGDRTFKSEVSQAIRLLDEMRGAGKKQKLK